MINTLIYVTGNAFKFDVASKVFMNTSIVLLQKSLDTPEIQSKDVEDVAMYSAKWACKKLNQPVIVTDASFCIEALNGFPGPFIKFVNEWFSVEDYINLMQSKTNRNIVVKDCLAYCEPNKEPVSFTGAYHGKLSDKPGKKSITPIEQLFIPEGYNIPISDISDEEKISYWGTGEIYKKFKKYLLTK